MANAALNVSFIPSNRANGRYLTYLGYLFKINRKRNENTYWKCLQQNCKATIVTMDDNIRRIGGEEHNHPSEAAEIEVRRTLESMRKRARDDITPMPSLYEEEVCKLRNTPWTDETTAVARSLPTYQTVKDTLYRERRKKLPPLPTTRRDLNMANEWMQTSAGENFALINEGEDDRIMAFCTYDNLRYLCDAETIFCDGTFYVCPKIFYQLYTIHAMIDGQMFPLVFCLLPDKKQVTYTRLFTRLRDAARAKQMELSPRMIQMDFEQASRLAAESVFRNSEWKGCFFHFAQCIWRKT